MLLGVGTDTCWAPWVFSLAALWLSLLHSLDPCSDLSSRSPTLVPVAPVGPWSLLLMDFIVFCNGSQEVTFHGSGKVINVVARVNSVYLSSLEAPPISGHTHLLRSGLHCRTLHFQDPQLPAASGVYFIHSSLTVALSSPVSGAFSPLLLGPSSLPTCH